jgi:hypothetical protein
MKLPPKAIQPEILLKIGKIIPRLGSESDVEILAAARAIKRVLEAAKLGFHELSAVVTGESAGTVYSLNIIGTCEQCLEKLELREHETKFVHSIIRYLTLNPNYSMSDKQTAWLAVIASRLEIRKMA